VIRKEVINRLKVSLNCCTKYLWFLYWSFVIQVDRRHDHIEEHFKTRKMYIFFSRK